ncbi:hypothetical protein BVY02_02335, partial [bacterium J17]
IWPVEAAKLSEILSAFTLKTPSPRFSPPQSIHALNDPNEVNLLRKALLASDEARTELVKINRLGEALNLTNIAPKLTKRITRLNKSEEATRTHTSGESAIPDGFRSSLPAIGHSSNNSIANEARLDDNRSRLNNKFDKIKDKAIPYEWQSRRKKRIRNAKTSLTPEPL